MDEEPVLFEGGLAADDRGRVAYVNAFDFSGVKRFYTVSNHRRGFIRAWHGHRHEAKYATVVRGAMLVCCVAVDDWDCPTSNVPIHRFTLSEAKPSVLFIPAGYANGFMSLTDDAKIMFFSTASLDDSLQDDVRFDAHTWNPWDIEER